MRIKKLFLPLAVLLIFSLLLVFGFVYAQDNSTSTSSSSEATTTALDNSTSAPELTPTPTATLHQKKGMLIMPKPLKPVHYFYTTSTRNRGILSIARNGWTILRDTVVQSVDEENYTMVVKVWGVELKVKYGDALVVPGVTKNYCCPGKTVKECQLKNEPNALFFKEGDKANVTGVVEDYSSYPITIKAKRVYNAVYEKPLPVHILRKRIGKEIYHQIKPFTKHPAKPVQRLDKEQIMKKIKEILKQIEVIKHKIQSRLVQ